MQTNMLELKETMVLKQTDMLVKMSGMLTMGARFAVLCVRRMTPGNDAKFDDMLSELHVPEAALSSPQISDSSLPVLQPSTPRSATSPPSPPAPSSATPRSGSPAHRRPARRRLFDSALSSKVALPSTSDFGPPAPRSPSPSVRRSLPSQSSLPLHGLPQVSPPQLSCHAMHVWSLLSISPRCVRSHGLTSRSGWQRRARGCAGWTYI